MVKLTDHYKQRYKERVSKSTKNMQLMADRAFRFGLEPDKIKDPKVRKELENKSKSRAQCKVYRGYVWWFSATTIITVYTLPIARNVCHY